MILLKESHLLESLFSRGKLKNARVMKIDCEFGESTCIVLILFVQNTRRMFASEFVNTFFRDSTNVCQIESYCQGALNPAIHQLSCRMVTSMRVPEFCVLSP